MITFKNFVKKYSSSTILSIPDLNIPQGIQWIKGENGSGKTSLFKSLAGLLPYDGDIYFNDGTSSKKNPLAFRRFINYSEAEPLYPGFLTAKDLIRFVGKAKNADISQQNFLSKHFGINNFLNKPCQTYSSGMLKKLSLAIAFLGMPKIIILDEPLITLDEQARNILFDLINNEHVKNGTSFFISSHQLIEHTAININNVYCVGNKTLHHVENNNVRS